MLPFLIKDENPVKHIYFTWVEYSTKWVNFMRSEVNAIDGIWTETHWLKGERQVLSTTTPYDISP